MGIWVLAGYFLVGVAMNSMSRSAPERTTMTPVASVLAIACVLVALGPAQPSGAAVGSGQGIEGISSD